MLTILTTIVLDIIVVIVLKKKGVEEDNVVDIAQSIFFIGLMLAIFAPLSGYEKPVYLNRIQLESFADDEKSEEVFLKQWGTIYMYNYKVPKAIITEDECEYETKRKIIISTDVMVLEDETCTIPMMEVYEKEAKKSKWTLAVFGKNKSYVFYVPRK